MQGFQPKHDINTASELCATLPSDYFALSMRVLSHPVVGFGQRVDPADLSRGSYSRAEAWIFLVAHANRREAAVNNRGEVIRIGIGELVRGRRSLATSWNWTEKTVRYYLDTLEAAGMITLRVPDRRGPSAEVGNFKLASIITLNNYRRYQLLARGLSSYAETQKGPVRGPSGHFSRARPGPAILAPDQGTTQPAKPSGARVPQNRGPENTAPKGAVGIAATSRSRRFESVAEQTVASLSREKQEAYFAQLVNGGMDHA